MNELPVASIHGWSIVADDTAPDLGVIRREIVSPVEVAIDTWAGLQRLTDYGGRLRPFTSGMYLIVEEPIAYND